MLNRDVPIAVIFTFTSVVTFDFKVEHDMRLRHFRDVYFLLSFRFFIENFIDVSTSVLSSIISSKILPSCSRNTVVVTSEIR